MSFIKNPEGLIAGGQSDVNPIKEFDEPISEEILLDKNEGPGELNVEFDTNKNSVVAAKAAEFMERVKRGATPGIAAYQMHTSLKAMSSSAEMKAELEKLTATYALGAETRRQMIRAGLNKAFIENIGSQDINRQKLALDVAKEIAKDPEVNVTQPDSTVVLEFSEMGKSLKGISLPGIEPEKEVKEENETSN